MNEIAKTMRGGRVTQAAEGLPRWRWTTAELLRIAELGAFTAEDRFELIGGEIVPMSPSSARHQIVREEIEEALRELCLASERVVGEPKLNLSEDTYTEPDVVVRPAVIRTPDLRGSDVLLLVEIAATSRDYDLGVKAALNARHGVREYWVVDATTLTATVHTEPGQGGYGVVRNVAASETLSPGLLSGVSVRLADLAVD